MWLFLMVKNIYTLPVLLLLGLFVFAPGPVILAFVQDMKTQRPALLNGIYMTINFLSGSLSVLLVGWMGDLLSLKQLI